MTGGRVYLDWNATAPLRAEARVAMAAAMDVVGNPSSVHAEGRAAKALIERARAQVAEADIGKLKVGMPVYFTTLGHPDRRRESTIRQILPTPEVLNDVVLYNVLIDIDNADRLLMSEMTAQVFFLLGQARDVPLVPVAALRPTREGDHVHEVTVLTARGPELRRVETGIASRVAAEVVSGLEAGDEVILGAGAIEAAPRDGSRRFGGPFL